MEPTTAPERLSFFSFGRRPADQLFFLGGGAWSALAMCAWIGVVAGWWDFAGVYGPVAWHAHALLFGYVGAVLCGFLLTAIPNWSRRPPIAGAPLLAMFALWTTGRLALPAAGLIGIVPAAVLDSLFLPALALVSLREIVSGRNWRNLKTVGLVAILAAANVGFHVEVIATGTVAYSLRAAIAAIVGLIMMIGGRIVPSFTRDWLVQRAVLRLPAPYDGFDTVSLLVSVVALALWIGAPAAVPTGLTLIAAGLAQAVRLSRWAGLSARREPLVFVLHAAYVFVPLGFAAVGAAVLWPAAVPIGGALHIWTAGAMALMTLAVMTRAALGHAGRELTADRATVLIYAAAATAALARFLAALSGQLAAELLILSAVAWVVAFAGFLLRYGALLSGMRWARRKV